MGMGNGYSMMNPPTFMGGQVYFDPIKEQYYTQGYQGLYTPGYTQGKPLVRTYLDGALPGNQNKSPVSDMLARANAAAQNVQTPTLASLFPGMSFGQSQTPMLGNQFGGQMGGGQFGAGRFLGNNQFGNPAMPMGGFANNTTT